MLITTLWLHVFHPYTMDEVGCDGSTPWLKCESTSWILSHYFDSHLGKSSHRDVCTIFIVTHTNIKSNPGKHTIQSYTIWLAFICGKQNLMGFHIGWSRRNLTSLAQNNVVSSYDAHVWFWKLMLILYLKPKFINCNDFGHWNLL